MSLDINTIIYIYTIFSVLMLLVTLQIWHQNKNHFNGLHLWVAAHIFQLTGMVLLSQQNRLSMIISSFMASMIILVGFALFIESFQLFNDAESFKKRNIVLIGIASLVFAYFTLYNNYNGRIIAFTVPMLVLIFEAIYILVSQGRKESFNIYFDVIASFALYAIIYSIRLVNALTTNQGVGILDDNSFDKYYILGSMVAGVIMVIGLVNIINGKLVSLMTSQADEREKLLGHTKTLAETDALTGLYNRMKSEEILINEISYCQVNHTPLSIFLLDIDFFKDINDTYGHLEGDRVLREFAKILQVNVRESDYCGRWGGDEFIVIIPDLLKENAAIFADKLTHIVGKSLFLEDHRVTISVGVAVYQEKDSKEDLLSKADQALYDAKTNGRNQMAIV